MKVLNFILFFIGLNIYSQNYELYKPIIDSKITIDHKIEHIDLLIKEELKKDTLSIDYFRITDRYTTWLYENNSVDKSLSILLTSIELTPKNDKKYLEKRWYKLAVIYRNIKEYKKSIDIYKKIIASKEVELYYLLSLKDIADCYYWINDYELSRKYYDLAEKELLQRKKYERLIENNSLSSNTYLKIDDLEAKSEIERKLLFADSLSKHLEIPLKTLYNLKIGLVNFYSNYENRDTIKGIKYADQTLALVKKEKDSNLTALTLLSKAIIWDIDAPEKSIALLEEALSFSPKEQKLTQQLLYANLGLNKAKMNLLDQAINDQHTSIELLIGNNLKEASSKEAASILSATKPDNNLMGILSNLAETYYLQYKKTKNKDYLNSSIQFFKYSDLVVENYFKSDVSNASKLLWRSEGSEIYSRALRSCYEANDIESALFFIEKSKSLLLYEEITNFKTSQTLNISDTLLIREKYLKSQLNRLERLQTTQSDSLKKIIAIQDSLHILSKTIKEAYPDYKDINEFSIPSLSEVQQQLKENEVILEYHISADNGFGLSPNTQTGYGLLITPNKTHLYEINNLDTLKTSLNLLLAQLKNKQHNNSEINKYKEHSIAIFNQLVPNAIREDIQGKTLTIIPDNYLSNLPFEALVTSDVNEETRYFIQDNEIHYTYSAGFEQLIDHQENEKKEYLLTAFAPVDFKNSSTLEHSYEEVTMLDTYIDTQLYTNKEASTENFINSLGTSKIIHLATHATIENNDPLIEFSNGSIHLDEISTLSNNASLVVLSACETTTGEIADGEGVLSLARGFFYGGAEATLSSLWQVDDKATYAIMDTFYKNLSEGDTKSSALRKAKIEYLNTHSGSERSPYYWSSFVLTGTVDPIATGNNHWMYYLGIAVFSVGIVLFMLSRKRKKINSNTLFNR